MQVMPVEPRKLGTHYREIRKRLASLKPPEPTAQIIPINVVPFEAPVPVKVEPPAEPIKPYIVPREIPMLEDILAVVSRFYNTPEIDILSHRRTAGVVRPRHMLFFLGKEMTLHSLPTIGRWAGRDHTTILSSIRRMNFLRYEDARVQDEIDLCRMKVNERVAERNGAAE